MAKLTESQIRGLIFLLKGPWLSSWWGNRPHSGWPKELNRSSFGVLQTRKYVTMECKKFHCRATITDAGRAALSEANAAPVPDGGVS